MFINNKLACHQQQQVQKNIQNSSTYSFFNLLTCDALLGKVEPLLPEHRERLYPPTETLSMFLAQAMNTDRSCQNIVNQSAIQKVAGGIIPGSTGTGGYCKARKSEHFSTARRSKAWLRFSYLQTGWDHLSSQRRSVKRSNGTL